MFFTLERISQLLVVLYRSLSIEHYNIRSPKTESQADMQSSWKQTETTPFQECVCLRNVFSFMQNLEKGTFKTEAMKDISHRLKEGEGARWECLAKSQDKTRHNVICSLSICASVKGNTVQTKSKSGKSGQCSVLVQQVLPKASLYCCHLHSPQELHLHVLC